MNTKDYIIVLALIGIVIFSVLALVLYGNFVGFCIGIWGDPTGRTISLIPLYIIFLFGVAAFIFYLNRMGR